MKQFKMLTNRCVHLILNIGDFNFSILSSFLLIITATLIEIITVFTLDKKMNELNLLRLIFFISFTVVVILYFLSRVIKKVEQSRQTKTKNQQGILEEAHKIESACGSVGLSYLQQCCHEIQTTSQWNKIQYGVDDLKQHWKSHIKMLREWI